MRSEVRRCGARNKYKGGRWVNVVVVRKVKDIILLCSQELLPWSLGPTALFSFDGQTPPPPRNWSNTLQKVCHKPPQQQFTKCPSHQLLKSHFNSLTNAAPNSGLPSAPHPSSLSNPHPAVCQIHPPSNLSNTPFNKLPNVHFVVCQITPFNSWSNSSLMLCQIAFPAVCQIPGLQFVKYPVQQFAITPFNSLPNTFPAVCQKPVQ